MARCGRRDGRLGGRDGGPAGLAPGLRVALVMALGCLGTILWTDGGWAQIVPLSTALPGSGPEGIRQTLDEWGRNIQIWGGTAGAIAIAGSGIATMMGVERASPWFFRSIAGEAIIMSAGSILRAINQFAR